jgi:hypothetical protein
MIIMVVRARSAISHRLRQRPTLLLLLAPHDPPKGFLPNNNNNSSSSSKSQKQLGTFGWQLTALRRGRTTILTRTSLCTSAAAAAAAAQVAVSNVANESLTAAVTKRLLCPVRENL